MSNVQVTNGTIKYERNVKTADYEGKKASVELSFNVPEGEDVHGAIEHVKTLAHTHCHSMLNRKEGAAVAAEEAAKPVGKAPKAPKPPVAAKSAAAEVEEDPLSDRAPLPKDAEEFISRQPAHVQEKIAAKTEPAEENLDDLLGGGEEAREITDKELTDATQKCQARAKNGPAIRKTLNDLGIKTPPGRIIDIPQDKRQEYLNKLEEIKPLA